MKTVLFPDLDAMLLARRVRRRDDGSFAEDSYDYGVWWRDAVGGVFRLTWIGAQMREDDALAGELYLVRLSGPHVSEFDLSPADLDRVRVVQAGKPDGDVELLCVIPPVPGGAPDENVERILDGWAEVCGLPNSAAWVRDRAAEAVAAGWATHATVPSR